MSRYDQCDDTCTVDCGHCKGNGPPALSPAEALREIAAMHYAYDPQDGRPGEVCGECGGVSWPCETRGILDRCDLDAVETYQESDDGRIVHPNAPQPSSRPGRRVETWRGPWEVSQ